VADGEAYGDTERACALERRRLAGGADRQRRNRHQVIRAKSVEKAQGEGCRNEEHWAWILALAIRDETTNWSSDFAVIWS
jgi:hypothetical protein